MMERLSPEDRAKATALYKELWQPQPVAVNRLLAETREVVLEHNAKRCPKWSFQFTQEDLAAQLQPRPTVHLSEIALAKGFKQKTLEFLGIAVHGSTPPKDVFEHHVQGLIELHFALVAYQGEAAWAFKVTSARSRLGPGILLDLRQRLIPALERIDPWDPALMFRYTCRYCGRGLTDPASMARGIGPECAGTASLAVGGFKLFAA